MPIQSRIGAPGSRHFSRRRQLAIGLAIALFLGLNLLAYFHARAMTTFSSGGTRSTRPEKLTAVEKARLLLTGVNLPRPTNDITPADVGLDYETSNVRGDDGKNLEVWRIPCHGRQALVVMFHGYSASKASLLPEAQALHELGCETLLVDLRGSGGSWGNETTLGVYEADDVVKAFEYARALAGVRPLVLYGKSMGSAAIFRAIAVNGVQPAAVVVECPFDRLLTTVENRFSAMRVPAFPLARLLVFWGGVQHGMNGFAHNPVDYAAGVRCPALVMHGSQDPRVSVAEAESIFTNLAGKRQLVLFPQAGHESHLVIDPEHWKRTVAEFLESLDRDE